MANIQAYDNRESYERIRKKINTNFENLNNAKAEKSNVLELDNSDSYTPTGDYNPATKKYVDDNAGGSSISISEDGTQLLSDVTDINFNTNINVTDDGDGTVTVDSTDTNTQTDVSEDGTTVVSSVSDINFASNITVSDDTDGTVTVESIQASDMSGITDTLANFNASCSDGTFAFEDDNISIFTNDAGYITSVSWGDIGGTLSDQTDLQNALDSKEDVANLLDMAYESDAPSDGETYGRNNGAWTTIQGGIDQTEYSIGTVTTNTTIDRANGRNQEIAIGADVTLSFGFTEAGFIQLEITNGGDYTVTWGNTIQWAESTAPTLTSGGTDIVNIWYDGSVYKGDYGYNFG